MTSHDAEVTAELMRHPKTILGVSNGGAHAKFNSNGQWGSDIVILLVRKTGQFTLEAMHHMLSARPAGAFGFDDRGALEVFKAADLYVYDFDTLNFERGR